MTKILFLCHGNICRSPMAEFVMKKLVSDAGLTHRYVIDSAAVSREEIGNPIYPPARRTLNQHAIPFSDHRARQVTDADCASYDLIVCMDASNIRILNRHCPQAIPSGKVHLLMDYAAQHRDVADPWYTDDFETTYRDLMTGCQALLQTLEGER